ncbi:phosphate ABC transporter permease subunit PstC [Candidatus Acetothermia bacterium]|jgi:phosphate transport system permease protein|nr:phosphate ABC transporter permease subunit PstC [Candidatus Acetothermia bacterium]MCI2432061.1 phosphate ABC transporter permease subunit PstC [Candidatus Acetothermia bacterium]MCI2435728.1 phosphate ABC transporter permease subunit PstC [Candidatus Acetothermia bacterium]
MPREIIQEASSLQAPRGRYLKERLIRGIFFACAFFAIIITAYTIIIFAMGSAPFFESVSPFEFIFTIRWSPLIEPFSYGALPLIGGTLLTTGIALLVALPLGLLGAVYLSEYASPNVRRALKPIMELLAGIPSVVFGYFALLYVTPLLRNIFPDIQFWNALSAGLVLGIAILPLVSSLSEDIIYAVPRSVREASYALGATRFETVRRVVLPAAFSGITAAFILGMSRAIGETMIVAIAAGMTPVWPPEPLRPVMTLTAYIVNVATGDAEAGAFIWSTIFAVGALLFMMTLILNTISYFIVQRFREQYE